MRDQYYPNRTMRLSDEVWERLKKERKESSKSWNLFLKSFLKKDIKRRKERADDTI